MTPELQQSIYDRFPVLFERRHLPPSQACMCWGLDVGDGWAGIVERLATDLDTLRRTSEPDLRVEQVKEKFGLLRVCCEPRSDAADAAIRAAEFESGRTCERCGAPGERRGKPWIMTLCDECIAKRRTV